MTAGLWDTKQNTNSRPRPRLPLDSNIAISLRMGFLQSTEASVNRRQTSGSDDRQTQACRISATANENKHGIVDILHVWLRYFELVRTLNYTVQVIIQSSNPKTRIYRHPKPGFSGLEKSRVTRVFGFGKTRVGNTNTSLTACLSCSGHTLSPPCLPRPQYSILTAGRC